MKYRFGGKENLLALGLYPDVTLAKAGKLRTVALDLFSEGKDPSIERRQTKLKEKMQVLGTFEAVGTDWHRVRSDKWSKRHFDDVLNGLQKDIFPYIGRLSISEIDMLIVKAVLDKIQNRGALEIGSRLRQRCSAIFKHDMVLGLCHLDPADALKFEMRTPTTKNLLA